MNTIFEKKFNDNFPKRDFQHKLNIFLTCIWGLNLASSLSRGVIFLIVCHVICVLCWGIQWYFCAKKYNQKVDDYKKKWQKNFMKKKWKMPLILITLKNDGFHMNFFIKKNSQLSKPRKNFDYKLSIFSTFLFSFFLFWGLSLQQKFSLSLLFLILCNIFIIFLFGCSWYNSYKKYQINIKNYNKKIYQKEIDNFFNFYYIKK